MEWIYNYKLFLFDLDGLLVNTEELHYFAYKQMLKNRGFDLEWDFNRYCHTAHYHADKIAHEFYELFPSLYAQESSWQVLYNEKKSIMMDLIESKDIDLMPGVFELLSALERANIKRCVVTHSPDELVSKIRRQHPLLEAIPHWITRHDYTNPKPHPECYLKAIKELATETDTIIGFEDSPRGLKALMGTRAKPVLICHVDYPEIGDFVKQGALHFPSFKDISCPSCLVS